MCNTNDTESKTKALNLLRELGLDYIQQPDMLVKNSKGEWIIVEVKYKELFKPGPNYPHLAAGLDRSQIYLREKPYEELKLRTYLLCFVPGTDGVYGAYLDELEKRGEFYDCRTRVYPIEYFSKGIEQIRGDLNG